MSHLLALVVCLAGFCALALATQRQQDQLFGRALPVRVTAMLRLLGIAALGLALGVLVQAKGWGLGLVSYSGHTSLAAGAVYGALIACARARLKTGP